MTKREIIARNIIEVRKKFVQADNTRKELLKARNESLAANGLSSTVAAAKLNVFDTVVYKPLELELKFLQAEYLRVAALIKYNNDQTPDNYKKFYELSMSAYCLEELHLTYKANPSKHDLDVLGLSAEDLTPDLDLTVDPEPLTLEQLEAQYEDQVKLYNEYYARFNAEENEELKGELYRKYVSPLYNSKERLHREIVELKIAEQINADLQKAQAELENFKNRKDNPAVIEFMTYVIERDINWFKAQAELRRECGTYKDYFKQSDAPKWAKEFINSYYNSPRFEVEIILLVVREAQSRVAKLLQAVEKKVGTINQAELKFNPNCGLDGYVQGTDGTAHVSTVLAGGYNIQRLHYRTLIKACK